MRFTRRRGISSYLGGDLIHNSCFCHWWYLGGDYSGWACWSFCTEVWWDIRWLRPYLTSRILNRLGHLMIQHEARVKREGILSNCIEISPMTLSNRSSLSRICPRTCICWRKIQLRHINVVIGLSKDGWTVRLNQVNVLGMNIAILQVVGELGVRCHVLLEWEIRWCVGKLSGHSFYIFLNWISLHLVLSLLCCNLLSAIRRSGAIERLKILEFILFLDLNLLLTLCLINYTLPGHNSF